MARKGYKCGDVEATETKEGEGREGRSDTRAGPREGLTVKVTGDVKSKRSTAGRNKCANR